MQRSEQMSDQMKLEHARAQLAVMRKDVQLVLSCLPHIFNAVKRIEVEIDELERGLREPDTGMGERAGVFTEATGALVPATHNATGASVPATSINSTQSRPAGGIPLSASRAPVQDDASLGLQSPRSHGTPMGPEQGPYDLGQHGHALQPPGASGVAVAAIPTPASAPLTPHSLSGLVGQNVQGSGQPQANDYRGSLLQEPTAPENFVAPGGHGGHPSLAASGFGEVAGLGGFGAVGFGGVAGLGDFGAAGFGGVAGPRGFGTSGSTVESGAATGQSGLGVPVGPVGFGAPGSHGGFGAPGVHAGYGRQASSTTMSAPPVSVAPRPSSVAEAAQLAGRSWSVYLRSQWERNQRFIEAEAIEVLRRTLGPTFTALRTPEATSDYVVVTLSGLSEVLVLPSKHNVGQNTPFVQSFYQLRAELPSGSPAEVVVAAVVQPNNLHFPPAEGAIDKGLLRIKAS